MATTETRYFRSDAHTINGLNADKLSLTNTTTYAELSTMVGSLPTTYDVDIAIRHADSSETVLGSAVVSRTFTIAQQGLFSDTWSCPLTFIAATDALKITHRMMKTGVATMTQDFITEQMGDWAVNPPTQLEAATWTFYRYCLSYWSGNNLTYIRWGDSTIYDTRIDGIQHNGTGGPPSGGGGGTYGGTSWSQTDKHANITISTGDLVAQSTANGWKSGRAKDGVSSGKWYWEITSTVQSGDNEVGVGNASANLNSFIGSDANGWGYVSNGRTYHSFSYTSHAGWGQGAVLMIALDMDAGKLWFGLNGTWLSGDPGAGTSPSYTGLTGTIFPMCSPNTNGNKLTGNFGDSTLSYPIPTGFTAGPTVWNYEGVGIGDSIALGTGGGGNTVWTRLETLQGLATGDILNKGVNGEKSGDVDVRFQTDALDVLAKTVYLIAGTNDGVNSVTIPTVIANYLSMYNKLTAMSPTPAFVIGEVTPGTRTGGSNTTIEQFQEWVKKLNAAIRKFCVDNSIELAPAYQEMAETNVANEDDMLPAYATDTVHPNTTGYDRLGDLFNVAAVPSRIYRWGYSALAVNDESWDWWILNGTSSISGDPDVGTLVLPQNQNADSDVKCLEEFSKTITISPAVAAGTVTIKYRTSTGNFDRNDGVIGWNTYTAPFATSNQFIQIRLEGSSAADANVSTISMTWTAGVPIIALTGSLSGVATLNGSMALNLKLSGSLASVSTATGGIGNALGLAGSISGLSTSSGNLGLTYSLAGVIAGTSTVSGNAQVARALSGSLSAVSGESASLGVLREMQGTINGLSTTNGGLAVSYTLSGSAAGLTTLSGNLTTQGQVVLSGSISGTSTLSGLIGLSLPLAGSMTGRSTLAGTLTLTPQAQIALAGIISGLSTVSGGAAVSYNLTGSVNGLSICSAGLHAALSSGGAIQGSSSLQGTLGIPAQLKGDYAQKVVACGIRPLTTMKDGSVARLVHRK